MLDLRADLAATKQGLNSHRQTEKLDRLQTLLSRRAAVILEQRKVVISGNGVLRSLVATILLTLLMEIALIAFSIALTP